MNHRLEPVPAHRVRGGLAELGPAAQTLIGAFSWTELKKLPDAAGDEWQRAQQVAEAVYFSR